MMDRSTSIKCPKCESLETKKQPRGGWPFVIGFLLLGIPFFFPSKEYHCFECGENFKRK